MTTNYVEILVKSTDDAKPDMDALKARLTDLSHQNAEMRATVDDADAAAKLDKIRAQLLDLDKRTANPKITMQSAVRAEAQAHALEAAMAKLSSGADDAGTHLDKLDAKVKSSGDQADGARGRFSALRAAINGLTLGLPSGVGEMTMWQKAMVAANVATGIGEPLVAGLTVAVGGLASGLAAAGAGAGLFGVVAKQVWTQTTTAITGYQTAVAAVASATTKASRATALKQEKTAWDGLTVSQRGFAQQLMGTQSAWKGFIAAASPGVIGVLSQGLGMVPRALALIKPLLDPVETALATLLGKLGSAEWSTGLQSFIKMIGQNTGPAIIKLGTAVGHIAVGIGGILTAFMPVSQGILSGVDKITKKFADWGSTLSSHSGFKSLEVMAKTDAPLVISALTKLGSIAKIVGSQMSSMSSFGNSKMFLQVANSVLGLVNSLLKAHPQLVYMALYLKMGTDALGKFKTAITGVQGGISDIKNVTSAVQDLRAGMSNSAAAAHEATGAWGTFGGKLTSAGSAAKSAASSIGSGLSTALSTSKSALTSFASTVGTGLKTAFTASGAAIKSAALAVREWGIGTKIAAAATKVWTAVQAAFDVVMDANPIMLIIIAIAALVAAIVFLVIKFKPVRDFFKAAWKDIEDAFVDAWHFIDNDMIHPFTSAVGSLVDWVKSHFKLLATIIATVLFGPIGLLVAFVITHWNEIKTETGKLVTGVVDFFKTLPGKIMSAIAALPGMMLRAGANIIHALANGIKSAVGGVLSVVGNVGHDIANALTHPFGIHFSEPSEATEMIKAGRRIPQGLATGVSGGLAPLQQAAARMARAAGLQPGGGLGGAPGAGAGAGGAAGPQHFIFSFDTTGGDGSIMSALAKQIRVRGGNPNILTQRNPA
jgi:hypothetical protein